MEMNRFIVLEIIMSKIMITGELFTKKYIFGYTVDTLSEIYLIVS